MYRRTKLIEDQTLQNIGAIYAAAMRLGDGALLDGESGGDALHQEGGHLHLLVGVESADADEAVGEGALGLGDLAEDLVGVGAAEHGQLPEGPVAVVVVAGGGAADAAGEDIVGGGGLGRGDLKAGGPVVGNDVVDLLGDLVVGERGQEREGLVHGVADGVPGHHVAGLGGVGHDANLDGGGHSGHGSDSGSHCKVW